MVEQKRQRVVDGRRGDDVIVVEHQGEIGQRVAFGQRVDEGRQRRLGRRQLLQKTVVERAETIRVVKILIAITGNAELHTTRSL